MLRKLFATTALASVIATGAFAQDAATSTMSGSAVFNRDGVSIDLDTNGYFEADAAEILASSLIGKPVYNGSSDEADVIGDINDVLMSSDGIAKAVVVGVGGFLGIGEKEVAVDFGRVNWVDKGDERRLVIDATVDELNAAPEFNRATVDPQYNAVMPGEMDAKEKNTMSSGSTMEDTSMTKPMDMDDATLVDYSTLTAADVLGARVYDASGNDMGEVSDALLTDDGKTIEAYVLDIGGFLGIGEKPVALEASALQITRDENGILTVHTQLTEKQLTDGPSYTEAEYATDKDAVLIR